MSTKCNKKWKVGVTSFANKKELTNEQVKNILDCYNSKEYQDWITEVDKKDKKYDIYPDAKWQLEKSREIEKLWYENIKVDFNHGIVDFCVSLEIDFPESFDNRDVMGWIEGCDRLVKILLFVQSEKICDSHINLGDYEVDKRENEFLEELSKNQKMYANLLL